MELQVRLLSEHARVPARAQEGDAGLDLRAAEGTTIGPGKRASVGTGIAIEIPSGYAGLVVPRSGIAAKYGISLVNAPGLIDSGYRGEIRVLLLNTDREQAFAIDPGDRIAQLVVTPVVAAEPVEALALSLSARGDGGFGSTGR
jgi:dUTP pyrophosphatase